MKFIIDGTNVCYWREDRKFSFPLLLELLIQLKKRGDSFICFFDANIERLMLNSGLSENIIKTLITQYMKFFKTVPAGNRADDYIIVTANRYSASIITNDKFEDEQEKEYATKINWLSQKSQTQRLYKGQVMFFGEDFGNEWVLMIPDLGIENVVNENIERQLEELLPLLNKTSTASTATIATTGDKIVFDGVADKKGISTGKIHSIVKDKGFGFIISDDYPGNVYFKLAEMYHNGQSIKDSDFIPNAGCPVTFEISNNSKGQIAINIEIKDDSFLLEVAEASNNNAKNEPTKIVKNNDTQSNDKTLSEIDVDEKRSNEPKEIKSDKIKHESIKDKIKRKIQFKTVNSTSEQILRNWWYSLSEEWQAVFMDAADLTEKPDAAMRSKIIKLTYIDCKNVAVQNLEPLKMLPNLQTLICDNAQITNLNILETHKKLEKLICSKNELDGLEPLKKLTTIKSLFCDSTLIDNLDDIKNLKNIEELDIGNNYITDLSPISNLTKLRGLWCYHNPLTSIAPLNKCTKLKELWSHHTEIEDLDALEELKNLKILDCSYTNITNREFNKFKSAHINCEIFFFRS